MRNRLLVLIVAGFFLTSKTSASVPLDNYQRFFKEWGLGVGTVSKGLNPDTFNLFVEGDPSIDSSKFNIIICKKRCEGMTLKPILIYKGEGPNEDVYIYQDSRGTGITYFIPEEFLVSGYHREKIHHFLNSLGFTYPSGELSTTDDAEVVDTSFDEKTLYYARVGAYFLVALFFMVFVNMAFLLYRNLHDLKWESVLSKMTLARDKSYKVSLISLKTFLLLVLAYLPMSMYISNKDIGKFSITYFFNYTKDLLDPRNLLRDFSQFNVFRIFLLTYILIVVVSGLLSLLPSLVDLAKFAIESFIGVKRSSGFYKRVLFIYCVLGLFISFRFEFKFVVIYVLSLVLFIFLSGVVSNKPGFNLSGMEKTALGIMALLFLIPFILPDKVKPKEKTKIREESLVSSLSQVVLLPYKKDYSDKTKFRKFDFTIADELFADGYLINRPFLHKPLSSFVNSGSYMIAVFDRASAIQSLFKNKLLRSELTAAQYTGSFYTVNPLFDFTKGYDVGLQFDCRQEDVNAREIVVRYSYIDDSRVNESTLTTLEHTIAVFPGCDASDSVVTYHVPFYPKYISGDFVIFDFLGSSSLKNVSMHSGEQPLELVYLNLPSKPAVLVRNGPPDSPDTVVYSAEVRDGVQFTIPADDNIDISPQINKLLERRLLNNPLTLWSPSPENIFLKNTIR
ncbi:hypothetical protein A3K34_02980 [candidate division WWE3 bacterium RIFOXYC1_FULL_40_10]|uniref:Uncharacterized protein n=1 Tax=candidate division WWE3 bacterium RIFOXYA2_FULL_46_9 TaxID=1802636 RepID=A0A1F4W076_UNCKA|nr:MAG: hypothetical protein A3K58_02980 [candidate division WWE3 bacterium RIFOXYB1_FULL_40_22]OGC61811.1 MAG: hypothetical protein A3K37_02980 [candidate division WWE3 bacterium RIFOXYA1_FULL_40_11]OGC62829.1 MAG: hypothetical protein A2264_04140 [candidate division WWE3 bacterium RIFOXYA2_FULL_46_9]OGC64283.1 MAG: hypothetical protein A2326_00395 [candidate division WWE3 bacterium RIFOXYB2_FULL_41_6]OGC66194.1 MAG: hypothetical protein A3K34_02980 [candidate division WWE3 bacterium RIFOXYC1_